MRYQKKLDIKVENMKTKIRIVFGVTPTKVKFTIYHTQTLNADNKLTWCACRQ